LMGRIGKQFLGIDPGPDTETGGKLERVWLLFYAIASGIYRLVIVFSIAFGLADMLGMAGQILGVWVLIGGLIWPNLKTLRTLSSSPETLKRKWTVMQRTSAIVVFFVLLIAVIPLPLRTTVSAVIAPSPSAAVYSRAEGFVEDLSVTDGTVLSEGDPVMVLDRDAMRTELEALEARKLATEARLRAAQDSNELPLVDAIQTELSAIADGMEQLQAQIDAINITAERSGVWMPALRPIEYGMMVTRGQQLGWIIGNDDRRIVAQVPQSSGPAVRSGITGASVMVAANDVRRIEAQDIVVRSDASRVLPDPLLADRMGGPIMTDLESPDDQFYALNPAFNVVIDVPLPDLAIGRVVQLKLSHPPTSLFNRYWPRIVTAVRSRFGPGA
jgi:putative peptide zinc metalloprotease protein